MAGHLTFDSARFPRLLWRSVEHHLKREHDLIDEVTTALAERTTCSIGSPESRGKALSLSKRRAASEGVKIRLRPQFRCVGCIELTVQKYDSRTFCAERRAAFREACLAVEVELLMDRSGIAPTSAGSTYAGSPVPVTSNRWSVRACAVRWVNDTPAENTLVN